ncbi:hypothetical protein OWR29_41960 [Actinoplanes sp. Pm04-4]|uniref:Uncharacterized protein n=1 Tax=Paractinoplanes pyxinae TaxID=2997416 RepID=A0ABT4BDM0_9ACTN|nr:hypothetical protein [Actinoplanes pyxinae]MCY1144604.1 hypothetical protein [Actinoplanes pyxinae]
MSTGRRIGFAAAVLAASMSIATVVTATPALAVHQAAGSDTSDARKRVKGPRPVTRTLQAVEANEPQWVRVRWKTDRRICDARVVVWADDDVEITYPGDREFTSFSRGDSLGRGGTDFTAIRVEANYDRDSWALLEATISYTDCSRDSRTWSSDTTLMLPVRS